MCCESRVSVVMAHEENPGLADQSVLSTDTACKRCRRKDHQHLHLWQN